MVFTECLECRRRGLDHSNISGAKDDVEDLEHIWRIKWQVPRTFFDQGCQYLKGDLNIPASISAELHLIGLCGIPYMCAPDITGRLLLQKGTNLLDLAPSRSGIVQQVAQLARIGLYINSSFSGFWIAL
jgi:hypothetical protein